MDPKENEEVPRKVRKRRIDDLVALMRLEGLESRKPDQLSSGQHQRVALASVLAPQPIIPLLDEPFATLEPEVRSRLRVDTKRWQRELQISTILVTHNKSEALNSGTGSYSSKEDV